MLCAFNKKMGMAVKNSGMASPKIGHGVTKNGHGVTENRAWRRAMLKRPRGNTRYWSYTPNTKLDQNNRKAITRKITKMSKSFDL